MATGSDTTAKSVLDQLQGTIDSSQLIHCDLEHLHRLAMLGIIAAGVAHETNNLLTPAIAYLHAANGADADEAARSKAIRRGLAAAEQVSAITRAMLGFAGKSDNTENSANVAEAIERALQCMGREPRRDGISFVADVASDLQVRMSPVALQQVLMNLVLNACEVVRARQGWVRVKAAARGGWVEITVSDNGPGIPESVRSRLFEPFVTYPAAGAEGTRSANSSNAALATPVHAGTGLGLVVCKMLLDAADGEIEARSDQDRGSSFTIRVRSA
jgi:C4-dicarboxylate-specific signal transduction histidine kinase